MKTNIRRREFLRVTGLVGLNLAAGLEVAFAATAPTVADGAAARYDKLLILVELKGGNDGLNTVVPYADSSYATLRPRIGIKRDEVLQLDAGAGLHPALKSLMPLWQARELAIIQGVGYPEPNLSHFRSIEIWDTASRSDQYLHEGWLTRVFARNPVPAAFGADGVIVGSQELGPLEGGARAVAMNNPGQFMQQARLAMPSGATGNAALMHVLRVESEIVQAATNLRNTHTFATGFPRGAFGDTVRAAAQVIGAGFDPVSGQRRGGVAALRLTLNGFDTHQNQPGTHAALLTQLGDGLAALRAALVELNCWNSTVIATYAEFGRRPRENLSNGTDHGTVNPQFVLGGRVRGGLYGKPPDLARLDGSGNLPYAVDFRAVYATLLDQWWNVRSADILGARYAPLDFLRA